MRQISLAPLAAAALALGAAPAGATTYLPPCEHNGCVAPSVDGDVDDLEYANGAGFPLSNFDAGGPNGALRLHLQGEKLYLGLRIPKPVGTTRGEVIFYLDAARPGTSCKPTAEKPDVEDRRFSLTYDLQAGSASLTQLVGNGTTWQAANGPSWWLKLWPTSMQLHHAGGTIVAEVAITLRPAGASSSAVLADGSVGFAMRHDASGSDEYVPGGATNPPGDKVPCSWETLEFERPDGTPLSFSVWDAGFYQETNQYPWDADDVSDEFWERDVLCLLDYSGDIWDLVQDMNERRGLNLLPPLVVLGDRGTWLLTSRPIVASDVAFSTAPIKRIQGIWARLLTDEAFPPLDRGGAKAGEFIDVFCIDNPAYGLLDNRAPDRPSIVLGKDFDEYFHPPDPVPFDEANLWLSDVHDLRDIAAPQHPGTADLRAYIYPADAAWPTFGVVQDPVASTTMHEYTEDGDELSPVPEISATIELVRTDMPGHWNPKKEHRVTYAVTKLHDHDDGGCCADWFTDMIGFPGVFTNGWNDDGTPDGTVVDPGWHASWKFSAGTLDASVRVLEWDSGPNDHYDVVPETPDLDPWFRIHHDTGVVERIDLLGATKDVLGSFEQSPMGFVKSTTGNTGEVATATHSITVEELD